MICKTYTTKCGDIRYWISSQVSESAAELVFLPGLTADHRLFEKQIEYFEGRFPLFVWDAPGHASSWPFELTFTLVDKARWLGEILEQNGFDSPVIIGQSMGGFLGQAFQQLFPGRLKGFISVDSAPLQKEYYSALELWLLKRMEPVYRRYPWSVLVNTGSKGVATSEYGRTLMRDMMMEYDGDQNRYAGLAGHGFRMLAQAAESCKDFAISCPAMLICGEKDRAGSSIRYNRAWHRKSGIPIHWIKGAGHNSNTDRPDIVNRLIENFIGHL
ncbi:MAG: alpha/beta hydrolase [Oscillospiraceae bacterium]|nr:alpha/beta hydrolase [Oscillospiraceae bacterium]